MDTEIKNRRQNRGSYLKNIRGSEFRRKWISDWLDGPENEDKHYKDAVETYIKYKSEIAELWTRPVKRLLDQYQPSPAFENYKNLLKASKINVAAVKKALTATINNEVDPARGNPDTLYCLPSQKGWLRPDDKYICEMTKPSGKTGKWIRKLKGLCDDFSNIKSEKKIVPGLQKIIDHCTYTAGDPAINDLLPLYRYGCVHLVYAELAERLRKYRNFVADEMDHEYPRRVQPVNSE